MARTIPEWVRRAKKGTTGKRSGFKHGFRSGLEVNIGASDATLLRAMTA